ncbi:hypothetical protein IFR05_012024 [Cadophora sp. M221]|nr:hypothetical protein IFR05_012024 [Cadophora sp. M221]
MSGDDRHVMVIDDRAPILNLKITCRESRKIVLGKYEQVPGAPLGLRGLPPISRIPVDIRTDVLNFNNVPFAYLVLLAEPSQLLSKLTTIAFDLEIFGSLLNRSQNAAIAPLIAALGGMQRLKKIIIEVKGCDHFSSMTMGKVSRVSFLNCTKTPPSKECEDILARFQHVSKQDSTLKSLQTVELVFVESRRTDLCFTFNTRVVTSIDPDWHLPIAPVVSSPS